MKSPCSGGFVNRVRRQLSRDPWDRFPNDTSDTFTRLHRAQVLPLATGDCLLLDLLAAREDCVAPPMVCVGWSHVVQRLVVAPVVVVIDEATDRTLQLPWAVVVVELYHILHRPVVALDLPIRRRGATPTSDKAPLCRPGGEVTLHIGYPPPTPEEEDPVVPTSCTGLARRTCRPRPRHSPSLSLVRRDVDRGVWTTACVRHQR